MKKIYLLIIFTFIFMFKVYAFAGENVFINIESYDNTIASGSTSGETFVQCLDNFSSNKNLTVVYDNQDGFNKIFSINSITENKFNAEDGWNAYIIRGANIIHSTDMLDTKVINGDKLVLYYGKYDATKIIKSITPTIKDNNLSLKLNVNGSSNENLTGMRVHLYTPKKTQRIIKTDAYGIINSRLVDLGMYSYYTEGYSYNSYPIVVKTIKENLFFGPKDKNATTRGEAIDFIINNFSIGIGNNISINFDDVNINDFYYQELNIATTNKLVSGYGDGTFKGDRQISLAEFAVILSKTSNKTDYKVLDLDAPSWAINGISKAISLGYVSATEDFHRNVTENDLLNILKN